MAPLNLIQVLMLFVIGQGIFLTLMLLVLKKGDRTANRLLAGVVLLISYFTFTFFLYDTGYRKYLPVLPVNGFSIVPLIPVLFYLYLKQLTTGSSGKNKWIHIIPFAIQFIYWLPNNMSGSFYSLSKEAFQVYYSSIVVNSVSGLHIVLFAVYGYAFFKHISFDEQNQHPDKLRWLKEIRHLYSGMVLLFTFGTVCLWFVETDIVRYIFFVFLSFIIYLIGYKGYSHSGILFHSPQNLKPKYFHSNLSQEDSKVLFFKLLDIVEKDELYLNPNIKLVDVAEKLASNIHDLSRSINENHGQNFTDFINQYRVKQAKQILSDETKANLKMYAVALDSGFSNKVTFYQNFKKFTGSLPAEFRASKAELKYQEILG